MLVRSLHHFTTPLIAYCLLATALREAGRAGRAEVVSRCVRLISFEFWRTRVERAPLRPLLASTVAGGVSLLEAAKAGGVCRLLRRRRRPRRLQPRRLQARLRDASRSTAALTFQRFGALRNPPV